MYGFYGLAWMAVRRKFPSLDEAIIAGIVNYVVRKDQFFYSSFVKLYSDSPVHLQHDLKYRFEPQIYDSLCKKIRFSELIPIRRRIVLVFGFMLSNLYSLLEIANGKVFHETLIRGWSERSEEIFADVFRSGFGAHIVCSPFFRPLRQFRWFLSLRRRGVRVSFFSHRYNLKDLISVLRASDIDRFVSVNMCLSQQSAARFVGIFSPAEVYTTDEWDPFGVFFYDFLRLGSCNVFNRLHGVGLYCPIVSYTELTCMTGRQLNFYSFFSKSTYCFLDISFVNVLSVNLKSVSHKPFVVFGQCGGCNDMMILENEEYVIQFISKRFPSKTVYYKFHPNCKSATKKEISYKLQWANLIFVEDVPVCDYIGFSLFSTTALCDDFPHFLIRTKDNDPSLLFDDYPNILDACENWN